MADYKKMYLTAVDAMEKAMTLLEEAQRKCEDIYIETDDTEEEPADLEGGGVQKRNRPRAVPFYV